MLILNIPIWQNERGGIYATRECAAFWCLPKSRPLFNSLYIILKLFILPLFFTLLIHTVVFLIVPKIVVCSKWSQTLCHDALLFLWTTLTKATHTGALIILVPLCYLVGQHTWSWSWCHFIQKFKYRQGRSWRAGKKGIKDWRCLSQSRLVFSVK